MQFNACKSAIFRPLCCCGIDFGQTRLSDAERLWVWLNVPEREDNLLCAVLVLEDAVVVKTVTTGS